jgi:hypothetical protein
MVVTKADFNSSTTQGQSVPADENKLVEASAEAALTASNIVVLRNIFDVETAKTKAGYLEVRLACDFTRRYETVCRKCRRTYKLNAETWAV